MKHKLKSLIVIAIFTLFASACTNEQVGTGVGAAAGSGLGYAVTGSGAGAAVGAVGGALIGNQMGKNW